MKRIGWILLAGVTLLSAVAWDIERINTSEDKTYQDAVIALDAEGYARVVFVQRGDTSIGRELHMASNSSGSWSEKVVFELNDTFVCEYKGVVVDSKGNTFFTFWANFDIYLACDSSGEFETHKLTEYEVGFPSPALALDKDDNVHLVYLRPDGLCYGYIDNQGFHSQLIIDISDIADVYVDFDFVIDKGDTPHVFFPGSDSTLYHAFPSSLCASKWLTEQLSDCHIIYPGVANISAAINNSNNLHVAYHYGDGIRYLTNESGEWEEEIISENSDDYCPCIAVDKKGEVHVIVFAPGSTLWSYYVNKKNGWDAKEQVVSGGWFADGRFFDVDASGYGHFVFDNLYPDLTGDVFYGRSLMPLISVSESPTETEPLVIEVRSGVIYFNLSHTGSIRLVLYDASGRRVRCIASGYYPIGEHQIPFNTSELSSGVYFVRIEAGRQSASVKFVVTK